MYMHGIKLMAFQHTFSYSMSACSNLPHLLTSVIATWGTKRMCKELTCCSSMFAAGGAPTQKPLDLALDFLSGKAQN